MVPPGAVPPEPTPPPPCPRLWVSPVVPPGVVPPRVVPPQHALPAPASAAMRQLQVSSMDHLSPNSSHSTALLSPDSHRENNSMLFHDDRGPDRMPYHSLCIFDPSCIFDLFTIISLYICAPEARSGKMGKTALAGEVRVDRYSADIARFGSTKETMKREWK